MPAQVVFSSDVANLDEWANRTGLPLPTSAEALGTNYSKATKWFLDYKWVLVRSNSPPTTLSEKPPKTDLR